MERVAGRPRRKARLYRKARARGGTVPATDALIAATALENNTTLITDNVKDFIYINKLSVVAQKDFLRNNTGEKI